MYAGFNAPQGDSMIIYDVTRRHSDVTAFIIYQALCEVVRDTYVSLAVVYIADFISYSGLYVISDIYIFLHIYI